MGEETNKKVNETLSEEEVKDAAGGRRMLFGDMRMRRCEYCGRFFETDFRMLHEMCICPTCGAHLRADRRML